MQEEDDLTLIILVETEIGNRGKAEGYNPTGMSSVLLTWSVAVSSTC